MSIYGCARISTLDQDLSIQRTVLKAAGCEVIGAEKASGVRPDGRSELQVLLELSARPRHPHCHPRRPSCAL
jgi:DNA invertase Pin-like site-specific DNA recombinase